jgi:hypothetical protein
LNIVFSVLLLELAYREGDSRRLVDFLRVPKWLSALEDCMLRELALEQGVSFIIE